jgi:hypothetical protein
VSTTNVHLERRILRATGLVIAASCVVVFLLAATVRINQYRLRRNAEQLLADLKSLTMRESTYADARRVIDRWHDDMRQDGPCRPSWCDVQISLNDLWSGHLEFFFSHDKLAHGYLLLGGRPAQIVGTIRVRNNIVWGKGIVARVRGGSLGVDNGTEFFLTLIGRAETGSPTFISLLHPEYRFGRPSGCSFCLAPYAIFTPYADPSDVNRLMDIGFSCITNWHPCETEAGILPAAWKEGLAEKAQRKPPDQTCPSEMIRVLGRETESAAIVTISKIKRAGGYDTVTFELDDVLKPWHPPFPAAPRQYELKELPPAKEKPKERHIVFFEYPDGAPYDVDGERGCTLLPATPENLEVVRRGIKEDWVDHLESVSFPGLGDLKRPEIEVR